MSTLRMRYETLEFGAMDIHVRTLRDAQQFEGDVDGAEAHGVSAAQWSLFGVIWPSGRILARLMMAREIEGLKILEVGCGIGLASLVLNEREADITATDYNPSAERFLAENVQLNSGREIPFVRAGWAEETPGLGEFDLIIGSDVLYERGLVADLARFLDRHGKAACTVVIVDPGRGNSGPFNRHMAEHGFQATTFDPPRVELPDADWGGRCVEYHR